MGFGIALSTASNREEAEKIAAMLVEKRLAACVNIVPGVLSIYRWKGSIERADEVLMMIKTTSSLLPAIEAVFGEAHSYEVPELVLLQVEAASASYLKWINENLG